MTDKSASADIQPPSNARTAATDSLTITIPTTVPTAAQSERPSRETSHSPKSDLCGSLRKTIAADKVANAQGQISLGLARFSSNPPASTMIVTTVLYGRIKIAEKSTRRAYRLDRRRSTKISTGAMPALGGHFCLPMTEKTAIRDDC